MEREVPVARGDRSNRPVRGCHRTMHRVPAGRGALGGLTAGAMLFMLGLMGGGTASAQVLDAIEVRSFGQIDGPPGRIFDRVGSVVFLGDGRLLVADGGSSQIRIYGDTPDPVLVFGRSGQGPGEFTSLDWAAPYRADSVVAWDSRQGRLTVMTPGGEHGRTIGVSGGTGAGFSADPKAAAASHLSVIGPLANGGFIARRGNLLVSPGDTTGVRRDTFTYVLLGSEGGIERELVRLPDDEQFVWAEGNSRSVRGRAFGRVTAVDARGMTMAWASNDGFRATTLDLASGARSTLEANVEPAPVREPDRRRWRQENGPPADMPPVFSANLSAAADAMIFPERMPWHGRLVIADDGAIWLEHYPAAGARPVWTVFAKGSPPRSIGFPAGFRLTDVSGGLACGITVGEFDVQRVTVFRLPGG